MTCQVVHDIFPDRRRPQHLYALGKAQGLADQAPVHMPRGQVGAFNVSRVGVQFSIELFRVTKDDPWFYTNNSPIVASFDHLQILPIFAGLLERWWASTSAVVRHCTIHFNQRFPMTAPSIRDQRRRRVGMMPTPFELA